MLRFIMNWILMRASILTTVFAAILIPVVVVTYRWRKNQCPHRHAFATMLDILCFPFSTAKIGPWSVSIDYLVPVIYYLSIVLMLVFLF